MYNVLLDPLPEEWNGHQIDPAFQNGIQIMQLMEDEEITEREKVLLAADLLFLDPLETIQEALDGIVWFMGGWNTDRPDADEKKEDPVMDWDIDQWRIYSAFRKQYGIDLNNLGKHCVGYQLQDKKLIPVYEDNILHFWAFMGLLTTLDDCAFTRVADIRAKKLEGKMDLKEKAFYRQAKKRYAIGRQEEREKETEEDIAAVEEFRRLAGLR
ncbi:MULTISPECIES: Gp15 family bacteriophage protein [Eisenbergiella]|uniref:Gp15 family bacteriophage protein n=1 Tax=Eisenbergiella TaxID=1432051 RepID=UPI0023F1D35B|nr:MULTISPECIES: Gp15 family bacteriophage protein [Eisenbergiella]MCI6710170.1 bacteriophage Gp15 family protein [Eisenbergiella massiliensis]MDY5529344.1 Gp15 family bacteriophage protein [Eisenbergiella porci]